MSDENNNENVGNTSGNNKVAETINAATGLVKAIPVYQDLAQPAAQELGKSLHTVAKLVNVALAPVSAFVWSYEKIREFVDNKVSDKLKNINPEDIISPAPNVAGPALEALKYTGCNETLSDMYACLLASAMDKNKAEVAHPAFVEIIKQLTPDEARIIKNFKMHTSLFLVNLLASKREGFGRTLFYNFSCLHFDGSLECPNLAPSYINNICRLGLAEIPELLSLSNREQEFLCLENHSVMSSIKKECEKDLLDGERFRFARRGMRVTDFGKQFVSACIPDN
ncbi:DUF4393 domain-containing protein [Dickeya zeae]|nr:DUF4393 domain-containing protein [Dickeya zeae]